MREKGKLKYETRTNYLPLYCLFFIFLGCVYLLFSLLHNYFFTTLNKSVRVKIKKPMRAATKAELHSLHSTAYGHFTKNGKKQLHPDH